VEACRHAALPAIGVSLASDHHTAAQGPQVSDPDVERGAAAGPDPGNSHEGEDASIHLDQLLRLVAQVLERLRPIVEVLD
jgi:hypothetical protein